MKKLDLSAFTISANASVREAMLCIDRNSKGIALVVDEDFHLMGTITDGDLRRTLLAGKKLSTPVRDYFSTSYTAVSPKTPRSDVLDEMRAHRLDQLPVVDGTGRLVGLHFLHEILGLRQRDNWAVIMAGGKGSRLRPITRDLPKPMISVAGRPILERLILHLMGHGFRRIFISVNHLAHVIQDYFQDGSSLGCRIEYLEEDEPLGTAGALSLLPESASDSVMVLNGDLVTQADLGQMLDFHEQGDCDGTLGTRRYTYEVPFGCVQRSGDQLLGIEEKPLLEKLINAGVYVLSPALIKLVPRRYYSMTELFEVGVEEGLQMRVFEIEDEWTDVGRHDQLRAARGGS